MPAKKPAPRKQAASKTAKPAPKMGAKKLPMPEGGSWKVQLEKRLRSPYQGRRKDIVQNTRANWVRSQLDVISESDYWNKPGVMQFSRKVLNNVYTQVSKRADEARWEPGRGKKK
jgi:hypothetical protein